MPVKDYSDTRNPDVKKYPKGMASDAEVVKTWTKRPKDLLIPTAKMSKRQKAILKLHINMEKCQKRKGVTCCSDCGSFHLCRAVERNAGLCAAEEGEH